MQHIAVIDYGMGNLRSVSKALETVSNGVAVEVTADPDRILSASHIVFPGQGAIRACLDEVQRLGLTDVIHHVAAEKPFLGICIGMQLLMTHSDENGGVDGLNLFAGHVHHFDVDAAPHLKVPHMGWNQVHQTGTHPLWENIEQDSRFYFVHSYYVDPDDDSITAATTEYPAKFTSVLYKDNIFAVQFHPEKSHNAGLQLLKNFVRWNGQQ
ncbi:MAG: imidazole glycerol phosphate synthase subunit HisH [Methylophaga sp.]|nr:MAG: imidazole glycerol phosphate synthase subunit HisH [Methylophaga sp.]